VVSVSRGLHSDAVKILSVFFGIIIAFGGVTHNAFGNSVSIGSSLAYLLIITIDLGGYIVGKILIGAFGTAVSGTALYPIITIGGGVIVYTLTSYLWFAFIYGYFKRNKKKIAKNVKRRWSTN